MAYKIASNRISKKTTTYSAVYIYHILILKYIIFYSISSHSSEKRGLRSMKYASKMLQNLLYFMYKKTHVVFFVYHFVQPYIFTLFYVDIDQGINKVKI